MTETAMRITLVTETYPPEINGVAITLGRAVEALRVRGHDVTLIRPRQAEEFPSPGLMSALPLFFYRQARLGCVTPTTLRRWLRDWGSEIIHVATEGPLGLAALIAARRLHIPAVTSFHTNFDQYAADYGLPLLGRGARIYLRAHEGILCVVSGCSRAWIWRAGICQRRPILLPLLQRNLRECGARGRSQRPAGPRLRLPQGERTGE